MARQALLGAGFVPQNKGVRDQQTNPPSVVSTRDGTESVNSVLSRLTYEEQVSEASSEGWLSTEEARPKVVTWEQGLQADVPVEKAVGPEYREPTPFPSLEVSPKFKVYQRGKKQFHAMNRLPQPELDKLPMFVYEPRVAKEARTRPLTPCTRSERIRALESDVDLVYALKLEAAFVPRSVSLMLQLKQKAKKWLGNWDLSAYTSEQVYRMVVGAVGQAMLVDQAEEDVRGLMHIYEERSRMRPLHTRFFAEGRTGSGTGTCLTRPKPTVAVWRRLFGRTLTRGIVF